MDLIQNQNSPINPERRDSSTIKNREDIGLGRVDNLSAADLLRLMGERTKDEVNKTEHHQIGSSNDLYELFSVSEQSYVSFFLSVTSKIKSGTSSYTSYVSGIAKIDLLISNAEIKSKVLSFGLSGGKLFIYGNKCVLKLPPLPGDGSVVEEIETCYYHFKESSFSPIFRQFSNATSNPRKEIQLEEVTQATSLSVFDQSGQIVSGYPYRDEYDYPTINGVPFTGEKEELRNIEVRAKHSGSDVESAGEHDWEVLENIPVIGSSITSETSGTRLESASIESSISNISQRASEEFGLCKPINSWEYEYNSSFGPMPVPSANAILGSLEANDDDLVTLGFLKSLIYPLYRYIAEKTPGYSGYFMNEVHIGSSIPGGIIEIPSTGGSKLVTYTGYLRSLDTQIGYPDQPLSLLYNQNKLIFSTDHPHVTISGSFPNITFSMEANTTTSEIVEEVVLSTIPENSDTPKAEYRLKFIQAPSEIAKEGYLVYQVDESLPTDGTTLDTLALRDGKFYENLLDWNFLLSSKGSYASGETGSGGRYAIFLAKKSEAGVVSIEPNYGSGGDVSELVPFSNRDMTYDGPEYTETTPYGLTWGYSLYSDESPICDHDGSFSLLDFKTYPMNSQLNTNFLGEVRLYDSRFLTGGTGGRPGRPTMGSTGRTMYLQIYQEALKPELIVDNKTVNLPYSESSGIGYIAFHGNTTTLVELIPEEDYSWISYTKPPQIDAFYFTVSDNPGVQSRTAYYKITDGYTDIEVSVTQQGQGVHWSINGFEDFETPVIEFLPDGETKTIQIASNVSYYIHGVKSLESGDWPLVYLGSQLITEDSKFGLDGETTSYNFKIYVPQNSLSGDDRSKTITLVSSEDSNLTKDIILTQSKFTDLAVRISPEVLTFQPVGVQTNTVLVTSTSQYTLIPDSDWLQAIPSTGGRAGFLTENEPIQIKCLTDNPSAGTRVGYIKVYESIDGALIQRGSLKVQQVGNLVLSALILDGDSTTIPVAGGTAPITISTNADGWEVLEDTGDHRIPSWITLSAKSGSASTQVINAVVSENTGVTPRSCLITFVSKYGGLTGGTSATVSISQPAGSGTTVTYEYIGTEASGINPSIRGTKTSYNFRVQSRYYKITTVNGVERSREIISETPPATSGYQASLVSPSTVLTCTEANNIITASGIPQNSGVTDLTYTINFTYSDRNNVSRSVSISFVSTKIVSLESVVTLDTVPYTGRPVVNVIPGNDYYSVIVFRAIPDFSSSDFGITLDSPGIGGSFTEKTYSTNTYGKYKFSTDESIPGSKTITIHLQGRIDGENVTLDFPITVKPVEILANGNQGFHPCNDSSSEDTSLWLTSDSNGDTILGTPADHYHTNWDIEEYGSAKKIIYTDSGTSLTHWVFRGEQGHVTPNWLPYIAGHIGVGGTIPVIRFLKSDTYNSNSRIYLVHTNDNTVSLGGLEGSLWSVTTN